jgi:hypothetical protein
MQHHRQSEPFIVAAGRIRLRPDASRLRFFWHTALSYMQARRAPGNLYAATYGADGVYYSLTAWRDARSMHAYGRSGFHRRAMRAAAALGDDFDFRHWQATAVPDWDTVLALFGAEACEQTCNAPEPDRRRVTDAVDAAGPLR